MFIAVFTAVSYTHLIMNEVTIDDFYAHISDQPYHEELRVSLSMTYNAQYQEAIEYLKDKGEGCLLYTSYESAGRG